MFPHQLLNHYFGVAMTIVQQIQMEFAKQHAAAVNATLDAVVAYAEWAFVDSLANHGLIQAP